MDESPEPAPPLRVICIDTQPSDSVINLIEDSPDPRQSHRQPESRISPINLTRPPSTSSAMMRTLLARYGAAPVCNDDLDGTKAPKMQPLSQAATEERRAIVVPPELSTPVTPLAVAPPSGNQGSMPPAS